MTARVTHGRLARCLVEPGYLDRLRASELGDDVRRSLDGLRLFAGFVAKVRHNSLRSVFPGTFAALAGAGVELEVFARYADDFQRRRAGGPMSEEERVAAFSGFLARDPAALADPGLRDLALHETLLYRVRCAASRPAQARPAGDGLAGPRIRGAVFLGTFTSDPREARTDTPERPERQDSLVTLAYVWDGESLSCAEIDPWLAFVLAQVDGSSAAEIGARVRDAFPVTEDDVADALRALARWGWIALPALWRDVDADRAG